jgi:hypothetical protein
MQIRASFPIFPCIFFPFSIHQTEENNNQTDPFILTHSIGPGNEAGLESKRDSRSDLAHTHGTILHPRRGVRGRPGTDALCG